MKRIILFVFLITFALSLPSLCPINSALERASTLYKWKYYDDSIAQLNNIISSMKEPWISRAKFLKASCYMKKGDTAMAESMFIELAADANFPIYDYAKFNLGEIYFNTKQYDRAIAVYKEIFRDSALWPEAVIRRAECLEAKGDINMAIETYKALIFEGDQHSSLDKARLNLGKCYEKTGNIKAAIKTYHEVNLFHPLSPIAKETAPRLSALSRKYKAYPQAPSADDLYNKAMVYYNFGDFNSANMFFNKIVTGYRASALWEDAVFKAAMCDYKKKRLRSAIVKFKALVARGGDYAAAAQFYMGFAYGKSGYFYQALDSLNKVVNNYSSSPYADDALFYLGYYYEVNGYKDTGLGIYEKFVAQRPNSEFASEAYWRTGRIYYFKKDYARALDSFNGSIERCQRGALLDACAYWKALALEKLGREGEAAEAYEFVVKRYDHTYYSYRAREKLAAYGRPVKDEETVADGLPSIGEREFDDVPIVEEPLPFEPGIDEKTAVVSGNYTSKTMDVKDHFKKYAELMAIGFFDEAIKEANILIENSPEDKVMSAKLALASAQLADGKVRDSIIYAEALCNDSIATGTFKELPIQSWQLAYPKGFYKHVAQYSAEFGIDENLVLAVIREESRFNPKTVSWANAHGLMQIIPGTGRNVARLIGLRSYNTSKLHDPDTNIRMGCAYLASLLKRFGGNKVLALAAYNGGPLRVQRWMNKWWNESGRDIDMDEFVESIPLSETRRYVQKVMKSYYEYKRLYTTKYPIIQSKG